MTRNKKLAQEKNQDDVCQNHALHCDTNPQFAVDDRGEAKAVLLDKISYVKLLIDARITTPDCWPPGTEIGAGILQRISEIEEKGQDKNGVFAPDKLARKLQDEYFSLNLALDEFQNDLQAELEQDVQTAQEEDDSQAPFVLNGAMQKLADQLANNPPATTPRNQAVWSEFPHLQQTENFA